MSAMLEDSAKRRIREDKILRFLVEGTVSETGSDFFRALARNLAEALQAYGAWITNNLLLALEKCGWKISGAEGVSALMGLPPSTIASRMKVLGIRRPIK